MSLLAPAADFHGMPVTSQGDQERRRRQSHTNHQQLTTPEAGAAAEEGCVIPSQRRLSWMPSQSLQPERRTSRFLTSCPGADPAVFRLTDHAVDNVEYATMQLLVEQRTELPARDTEAGGSDGRASANVHPQHQEESRNGESAEVIDWPDVAHFTHLTSPIPLAMDTMPTGLALPQQARIATAEERRVRLLFHSRPHIRLTKRPQVVANAVLDRPRWTQPLCYPPLCIPCLHNAFYSVPLSTVMRASWEPVFSSWQPSLAFSDSERPILPRREQLSGNLSGAVNVGSRAWATSVTAVMPTTAAFYHVPITAPLLAQSTMPDRRAGGELLLHPEPGTSLSNPLSHIHTRTVASLQEARLSAHNETTGCLARLSHKCRHFVYRCFCVRCAIASQAQALQADAEMRGVKAVPFPCCTCLGVESKSRSELLTTLCLLDLFTLGVPFGCCCYHGLGSALYGWHLRYMLRARYRIFAWTSMDLLIVCCIPGLALDQQGAELLLNGTPESTVGLQFMA
uniref:Uncharacterized protein n=1 Tax=Leishmania guyanensis TaxID=5670 RepID=A0A1E1ISV8_LEIGU|nr:hypothetical protein, conserved [Leishmania guyanensis]